MAIPKGSLFGRSGPGSFRNMRYQLSMCYIFVIIIFILLKNRKKIISCSYMHKKQFEEQAEARSFNIKAFFRCRSHWRNSQFAHLKVLICLGRWMEWMEESAPNMPMPLANWHGFVHGTVAEKSSIAIEFEQWWGVVPVDSAFFWPWRLLRICQHVIFPMQDSIYTYHSFHVYV